MIKHFTIAAVLLSGVAACSPQRFESEPVTLDTPQGPVVCQLYTKSMLDWDRSVSRPATMSVEAADRLCEDEGRRQQGSST